MQKITKGLMDGDKRRWKKNVLTLWNEDEVQELSKQLDRQQGALGVLVGQLNM
jgi:hypothetical protein